MKKILLFAVISLSILAVAGYFLFLNTTPPTYKTAKVEQGSIVATVSATGTLNAVTTVQVGTQVSGTIQKLFVDYNSQVKKGQIIAQIDPAIFTSQVQQSQGNLQSAQANLSKLKAAAIDAARTLKRNRQLLEDGIVSQGDFDTAETNYQEATAAIRAAEGTVIQTRGASLQALTNLHYATIRSPVDGVVVSRNVDVGQTVAASFQTPTLFTIAQDLTKMQINTSVDEADIGKVEVGQPVLFNVDAYPEVQFKGVVTQVRIAPVITQNVVTYDVVIIVENRDMKLKPGMTANVSIEVMRRDNVLVIPSAALRFKPAVTGEETIQYSSARNSRSGKAFSHKVFVLEDDQPVPVPVQSGITDNTHVEIVAGKLRPGQEVIVEQVQSKKKKESAGGAMGPRF
ncbi:MAG: efflux RND transporter periplasmic adaptor subunit [Geobacteraceae bacterium]|nr:efflux RND transporter periplasmic adaptor subunit [Geobacteraceae bacterium]